MKKQFLLLFLICSLVLSCKDDRIQNLSLEGNLVAKQILTVKYDLPEGYSTPEISWYISPYPDSAWEKLPGIWTDEIVLLTAYEGRYIKCEISCTSAKGGKKLTGTLVSASPVELKGNPATDWFRDAGFGIMVHYLSSNIVQDKGSEEWNDAVDSFNTDDFALKASEAGAGFVMFTLGQNSGYYCSPNAAFDSIVGTSPGDLCTKRDLPNISTHTLAAKAGNKNSIVTYNYGFGKIQVNTPYCDYSSGEKMTIDEFPSSRWVEPGVQWFLFTYLGEKWGGHGSQFKTADLVEKAMQIVQNEGVLCLEVVVNAKGEILPHHLEQIKAVGKSLGKTQ